MRKIAKIISILTISFFMILSLDTNLIAVNAVELPTAQLNLTNIAEGVNTILVVAESAENTLRFRQTIVEGTTAAIPLSLPEGTYRFRVVGYLESGVTPVILSGSDRKDETIVSGSTNEISVTMDEITIALDSSVPASVINGLKFTAKVNIVDPSNFMEDANSVHMTVTHGVVNESFDSEVIKVSDMNYSISQEITAPATLGNLAFSISALNSKFLSEVSGIGTETPKLENVPYNVEIVAETLTSITIDIYPTKLIYVEGDEFDGTGMKVVGHYDNGVSEEVLASDYEVSGFTSTAGQKTITITYGGFTATFNVTVNQMATPVLTVVSGGYNSIVTSWLAIPGATAYEVWRSATLIGVYTKIATVSTVTYTDIAQTLGKTSFYKVRATRLVDATTFYSLYSAVKSAAPAVSVPVASALSSSYTSIRISWAAISGATAYEVFRSTSAAGTFTLLTSTAALGYTNISLITNTNYYYKVRAYRTVGTVKVYSAYSPVVSAKPVPAVVTGVTAVSASYNSIKTSWTAVAGATGYEVSYSQSSGGVYVVASLLTTTSYTTLNLLPNVPYYFKVRAYRTVAAKPVFGSSSAPVSSFAIPATPIITVSSNSFDSLKISWTAIAGASGYEVLVLNGSTYVPLTDTTSLTFVHSPLVSGTIQSYKVKAYRFVDDVKVFSKDSAVVSNKPIPAIPTTLKAVSSAYNSVTLTWVAVAGATGYEILRATTATGTYVLAGTSNTLSYVNTGLGTNSTYYFKVRSYTLVGSVKIYSSYSAIVSAKPIPATPVVTVVSASYNSIRISWAAVSGVTKYEVWRSTSSAGVYTLINSPISTATSYINTTLATYTPYYYKVRAYRTVGTLKVYGSYSGSLMARPVPAIPTGVTAVTASYNSAKVSWTAVAGASGYEIQQSLTGIAGSYTVAGTSTITTFTASSLTTNTPYYFIVRAYRTVSIRAYGGFSSAATATPIPNTPIPTITSSSYNSLFISWPAITGSTGYELKVLNPSTSTFELLQDLSTTSFTHADLVSGITKTYVVVAYVTVEGTKIYGNTSIQVKGTPIPSVPGSTTAISSSYNSVSLSWAAVEGAIGYEVARSLTSTGTYALVTSTDQLNYLDTALATNTTYYYKVRAFTKVDTVDVFGNYSAFLSVRPIPATPTATTISMSYNSNQINWDPIDGATGYELFTSASSAGVYTLVVTTASTAYIHGGLTTNTAYFYKVRSYRTVGTLKVYSGYSAIISSRPIPSITTSVVSSSASYNSIKTTWTAVAGATGYQIYRSETPDAGYVLAGTSTTTTFTSTGLTTNKPYYFYVRAYRLVGAVPIYGAASTYATATAIPSTPTLAVTSISYNTLQLSWTSIAGASGYEIYRLNPNTGLYELFSDTPSASIIHGSLVTGTSQTYYVRAYVYVEGVRIYSNDSNVVSKIPIPGTSTLTVFIKSWSIVRLNWSAVVGASGYEVYVSLGTTGSYNFLTDTTDLLYLDSGKAASTSYSYKIVAYTLVGSTKIYGNYSTVIKISTTAEPKANITVPSATNYSTTYISLTFKNTGAKPMIVYGADALLYDYNYYDFDRYLSLVNSSNKAISSVTIAAGATVVVKFKVTGTPTYYDSWSKILYYFRYDGTLYIGSSSSYFGNQYIVID